MEKLKALIPVHLVHGISRTNTDDLPFTCSSRLDFFLSTLHFHQIVGELADREMGLCRKSMASALEWKRKGNDEFLTGDFINVLECYTQVCHASSLSPHHHRMTSLTLTYDKLGSIFLPNLH